MNRRKLKSDAVTYGFWTFAIVTAYLGQSSEVALTLCGLAGVFSIFVAFSGLRAVTQGVPGTVIYFGRAPWWALVIPISFGMAAGLTIGWPRDLEHNLIACLFYIGVSLMAFTAGMSKRKLKPFEVKLGGEGAQQDELRATLIKEMRERSSAALANDADPTKRCNCTTCRDRRSGHLGEIMVLEVTIYTMLPFMTGSGAEIVAEQIVEAGNAVKQATGEEACFMSSQFLERLLARRKENDSKDRLEASRSNADAGREVRSHA